MSAAQADGRLTGGGALGNERLTAATSAPSDPQKTFLIKRGGHLEYNQLAVGATRRVITTGVPIAGAVLAILFIPRYRAWSHFEAFHHH